MAYNGPSEIDANLLMPLKVESGDEAQITFQWNYACPENRLCTFVCRGAGGIGASLEMLGEIARDCSLIAGRCSTGNVAIGSD
jgi:hypothetical protein